MHDFLHFCKKTNFIKVVVAVLVILYINLFLLTPLVEKITAIYGPQIGAKQLEIGTSTTEYALIRMLLGGEIQNIIFQTTVLLILVVLIPFGVNLLGYAKDKS